MKDTRNRPHDAADCTPLSEHCSTDGGSFGKPPTSNTSFGAPEGTTMHWALTPASPNDSVPIDQPTAPSPPLSLAPVSLDIPPRAAERASISPTRSLSGPELTLEDLRSPEPSFFPASPLTPVLGNPDQLDSVPPPLDPLLHLHSAHEDLLSWFDFLDTPPAPDAALLQGIASPPASSSKPRGSEGHQQSRKSQVAQSGQRQADTSTGACRSHVRMPEISTVRQGPTPEEVADMFRGDHKPLMQELLTLIMVPRQPDSVSRYRPRRTMFRNAALGVDRETFKKMHRFLTHHGHGRTAAHLKRERRRAQNRETERIRFWKTRMGVHGLTKENRRLKDKLRATNAAIIRLTELRAQKRPPCLLPDELILPEGVPDHSLTSP